MMNLTNEKQIRERFVNLTGEDEKKESTLTEEEYDMAYILFQSLKAVAVNKDTSIVLAATMMLYDDTLLYHEKEFGGDGQTI